MSQRSTLLLKHHLKELRLAELELIDRHQRMVERHIGTARFPAVKSLDTFDFPPIPSVDKALVMERARCEYVQRRENVIAVGYSGTGKTPCGPGPFDNLRRSWPPVRGHVRGLHHCRSTGPRSS